MYICGPNDWPNVFPHQKQPSVLPARFPWHLANLSHSPAGVRLPTTALTGTKDSCSAYVSMACKSSRKSWKEHTSLSVQCFILTSLNPEAPHIRAAVCCSPGHVQACLFASAPLGQDPAGTLCKHRAMVLLVELETCTEATKPGPSGSVKKHKC